MKLRYMSKTQLARLYWPDQASSTALQYLQHQIDDDHNLRRRLRAAGWTPKTRTYTPRMIHIIFQAWQPP